VGLVVDGIVVGVLVLGRAVVVVVVVVGLVGILVAIGPVDAIGVVTVLVAGGRGCIRKICFAARFVRTAMTTGLLFGGGIGFVLVVVCGRSRLCGEFSESTRPPLMFAGIIVVPNAVVPVVVAAVAVAVDDDLVVVVAVVALSTLFP